MKKILFRLFCIFAFCSASAAEDIQGYWKTIDEDTGKPECMVAVYEYKGLYYGRMIATFDDNGKVADTLETPKSRAPGIVGKPYYCGLDFIYSLKAGTSKYKGKIVDPRKGNVYNAELWIDGSNLIVRGKWGPFGKSQTWLPVFESQFPPGVKVPDVKTFVPKVPEVD
jgi:uncharacterized protein (DUF2147 family)